MFRKVTRGFTRGCCLGLLFLIVGLLAVPQANAGVGGSITPTFPATVALGATNVAATVDIDPQGTGDENGFDLIIDSATLNPSCTNIPGACASPDLGVFLLHGATSASAGCGVGQSFTIAGPSISGAFTFVPGVVPFQMPDGGNCVIGFQFDVLALPQDANLATPNDLETSQAGAMTLHSTFNQAGGTGTGSDTTTVTFTCAAKVDKQISCDGAGTTWDDVPNSDTDLTGDELAGGCIGDIGENDIKVRYRVRNTGNVPITSCTINENNVLLDGVAGADSGGFDQIIFAGDIAASTTTSFTNGSDSDLECNSTLNAGEPDTGALDCTCVTPLATDPHALDSDQADFECCGVQIDKQISCNGGEFVDVGFADGATGSCSALDGQDVVAQYKLKNTSTGGSLSCTILDAGGGSTIVNLDAGAVGTPPAPGVTGGVITGWTETCGEDNIEGHEPNTATVTCACSATGLTDRSGGDTDADTAAATCDIPAFNISKACIDNLDGSFTADITINNTGEVALTCDVVDETFAGATCGTGGTGTPLFTDSDLAAPIGTTHSTFDFTPGATVCNFVTVTCDAGAGALDPQTAQAVCPVSEGGCLTRTPGFWKSHVNVVNGVIPVTSCGLELTQHGANVGIDGPFSTTQDLCVNNNEAKYGVDQTGGTSSQQFQIIRQCAAAALNLEASRQLELSCETADISGSIPFADIEARFATCCGVGVPADGAGFATGICNSDRTVAQINASNCIGYLDAFNNANFDEGDGEDSLETLGGSDWNEVDTAQCDVADADHKLNDRDQDNGRAYGPK